MVCTAAICGPFPIPDDDLTGDFCTSRTERLEDRKGPENAEKDVHAGADRGQAQAD
jgi:hypothetical protein